MVTTALWVMLVACGIKMGQTAVFAFAAKKGTMRLGAAMVFPLFAWWAYCVYLVLSQGYTP